MAVQFLSAVMVAALAAFFATTTGEEISPDKLEWLGTFFEAFLYAVLPPTVGTWFAWAVRPSPEDQVIIEEE